MNISTTSLNEWRFEQKKRLEWWYSGINIHCIPFYLFINISTENLCELYNVELNYFKQLKQ